MMGSMQDLPSLIQQIQQASKSLGTSKSDEDENSRKKTLFLAKELVATLEKPEDVIMRYAFELGSHRMCLRLGIDLRLFHFLVEHDGVPVSALQLAEQSQAEVLLVVRIMRVISAIGFAVEVDEQSYMATSLTRAFTTPALEGAMKICYDLSSLIQMRMHEYFRVHGYKCPTDSLNCAFQWTFATNLSYFEHMHQNPERLRDFNTFMSGIRSTRRHWIEWFPVETEIGVASTGVENDTLVVDVGGGKGHDLERFLERFPQTKGRLVLQDLPRTIGSIQELSPGIYFMAHDFFTPQPVKGSRVYYTHFVLHDWPDDQCRLILKNLMSAMKAGHSKLLLNESILPEKNCPSFFAAGDINMMSIIAGMKRTRKEWINLLQSVDLDVVRIWSSPYKGDEEGVIEAMLKVEKGGSFTGPSPE